MTESVAYRKSLGADRSSVAYRKIQDATSQASVKVFHGASQEVILKANDARIFGLFMEYDEQTIKDRMKDDQNR